MHFRSDEPVIPPLAAVTAFLPSPDVQVLDMPVDPNEPTYCLCHQVCTPGNSCNAGRVKNEKLGKRQQSHQCARFAKTFGGNS